MGWLELILIAVGLSMDAVAVSMSNGLTIKDLKGRHIAAIAGAFGLFQGLMPLIGYLAGSVFAAYISAIDHWVALILLGFIGGKMIWEALHPEDEHSAVYRLTPALLLVQAVATSIDALAVGVSFAALDVKILPAVSEIALCTFLLSFIAVLLGKRFGKLLGNKAELLGGVILVGIGLKIFIEHTFFG